MPSHPAIIFATASSAARSARTAMAARKRREAFFSPGLFGEPAWDLLLALCALEHERGAMRVTNLSQAAQIPATTALRWLAYLEAQQLVTRSSCEHDHRLQLVELTDSARRLLSDYFSEVTITLGCPAS